MSTPADLKRMTVPQLKALCKERQITGYSKLGKDALMLKLLGISPAAPAPLVSGTSTQSPSTAQHIPPSSSSIDTGRPLLSSDSLITSEPPAKKRKTVPSAPPDSAPLAAGQTALLQNIPTSELSNVHLNDISSSSPVSVDQQAFVPRTDAALNDAHNTEPTSTLDALPSTSTLTIPSTEPPASIRTSPAESSRNVDKEMITTKPNKRKKPPSTAQPTGASEVPVIHQQALPVDVSSSVTPSEPIVPLAPKKKKKKVADTDSSETIPAPKKKKKKAAATDASSTETSRIATAAIIDPSPLITSSSAPTVDKRRLGAVTPSSVDVPPTKKQKLISPPTVTNDGHALPAPKASGTTTTTASNLSPSETTSVAASVHINRSLSAITPTPVDAQPPNKRNIAPPPVSKLLPPTSKFVLPLKTPAPQVPSVASNVAQKQSPVQASETLQKPLQKRFKPLIKKVPIPAPIAAVSVSVVPAAPPLQPLYHLDFPLAPTPVSLSTITLPPPISQRKRAVPRFAVLLSQVSDSDLRNCVLVSRMFRYAVYLSASHRLNHAFAGKRLAAVLSGLDTKQQAMTNMWPYLKQRQQELSTRKEQFEASFLSRVFPVNAISEHLWASPDHERQIVVVLRFLLTRLFFQVSIGNNKGGKAWTEGQVVDAQQLVQDEVWVITMRCSASAPAESFYVLESTCEPLTTATEPQGADTGVSVRTDWSAYIAYRTACVQDPDSPPPPRLLEHLSWTNHEEYLRGISRLWLKRVEGEGEIGAAKRLIAERYILACVVENSVSGRWMSALQMAQDAAGLPEALPERVNLNPKVNMFLPRHHHVESVHLTTSGPTLKVPLHRALAVVQTPDREYFILRDNGMQVGCEEEGGVAEAWRGIIGCSSSGVALRA